MRPLPRRQPILAVLVALLRGSASVQAEDCNRNGVEDRVEIETPAPDFRLVDEVEVPLALTFAALDFDGDGDEDLVVDDFSTEGLVFIRNDGSARLARARDIEIPLHSPSIRAADLDGDSDPDLVLSVPFGVEIRWNDGGTSFSRSTRLPVGSGPIAVEVADLDGDADPDLLTANFLGNAATQNISVLLNEGGGNFAPPRNFAFGPGQPILAVIDADGDGDADLLVGSLASERLILLENDGRAAFHPAGPSQEIPGLSLGFLGRADIDGDGRDEALALGVSSTIFVLSHAGGGRIEVKDRIGATPSHPTDILARDFTGDGRIDLIVSSGCPDFTVLEGGPDGFRAPRPFWLRHLTRRLIAAHLDGDGLLDLAALDLNGKVFSLLQEPSSLSRDCNRNAIPDECERDCDRNGTPDDCDISSGASPDCDGNEIPDSCDPDCDSNGPDACDIAEGRAPDCDGNGIPDGCERSRDADGNGSPDACDIARDPTLDCDGNGELDREDFEPRLRFVQEEHELGIRPWSGRVADMDGDGDQDIVAGGDGRGISILEQLEDGSFARPRRYEQDVEARALAVLDADGDGDLDLAVATSDQVCFDIRGWVILVLNQGKFRLGRGPAYDFVTTPGFLEPADIDGDGTLDLVAGRWALPGRGDGTFAEPFWIGEQTGSLVLDDFDEDGDIDIASSGGAILLNERGWAFAEGTPLGVTGHGIAGGDIDGDRDTDLVIQTGSDLSILVNDGRARFAPGRSLSPKDWTGEFALGDLDGDGRADVVAATLYSQAAVSVLLSREASFVEVSPAASVGSPPSRLLVGDVTGDGLDDVVALVPDPGSAIVLKNRGSGLLSSRLDFTPEQVFFSTDTGDIDGDLDLDIAAVVSAPPEEGLRIALFENHGNASYSLKALIEHDRQPRLIRLADVNGDGKPDFIVEETRDGGTGFSVLRNQGAWSFGLEFRGPTGTYVEDLAVTDFDADGNLDIARLHSGAREISVVLNDGGGAWGDPSVTLTGHSAKLCVADVDGDVLPDLLAIGFEEVWVHRGAGGGRFKTPAEVLSLPGEISSAAAADIDADGDDDLVVGRAVTDCDRFYPDCWRLDVFLNVAGVLVTSQDHTLDGPIHALSSADIDGDGDLDILAGIASDLGNSPTHIRLFMSSGKGLRRGSRITLGGGGSPVWLAARDLDGDGDADIASSSGAGFSVLRNDTPPPLLHDADRDGVPDECERAPFSRGDADQDGSVSLSDAIATLGVLFQGLVLPACPAALDADDSGRLDITDPVRILGHLFLGRGPLPEPFAACGTDPTPDGLGCSEFGPCA